MAAKKKRSVVIEVSPSQLAKAYRRSTLKSDIEARPGILARAGKDDPAPAKGARMAQTG